MKTKYIGLLAALMLVFTACDSEDTVLAYPVVDDTVVISNPPNYTSGSANFSNYVAIGNSLTAGFSDGALFAKGQEVSFPNLLAKQFSLAGGGDFTQPLMNDDLGGFLLGGNPVINPVTGANVFPPRFIFDAVNRVPVTIPGSSTTDIANVNPGPYNNMGVPGAKTFHLLAPGYGNLANFPAAANPYFIRMASTPNASVLNDAMAMSPTFFTLWIGNNDVLGYATTGGDGSNPITPMDGAPGVGFAQTYNAILATLASATTQGVIANIPNVTDAPYFTTVPYAPLDPTNPAFGPQIPTLNGMFGLLNQVYAALGQPERSIVFSQTAASAVVIKDETLANISTQMTQILATNPALPVFIQQFGFSAQQAQALAPLVAGLLGNYYGQTRQANAGDLLRLPSSSVIGTVNTQSVQFLMSQGFTQDLAGLFSIEGITYGLDDTWVLIPSEQAEIKNATDAFNQVIANAASTYDIPLFDVNTFFNQVATSGYQAGSAFMTADFVTGGTFSLDGIHPSPRGNAVVVNQMIDIINQKYGSNLPKLNPVDFTGVYLN